MPSRNTVKSFDVDSMYHVYNRGSNKANIFLDERDYAVYLSFLKYALLSDDNNDEQIDQSLVSEASRFNMRRLGLADRLELVSFCLMPNHFHLLLYQHDSDAITALMRSVATGYTLYFNKRHKRVGSLYQGVYKAAHVRTDSYWQHISRYIHLNPLDVGMDFQTYPYSSYKAYMGLQDIEWVKPDKVLGGFQSTKEYKRFLKDYIPYRKDMKDTVDLLANSQEIKNEDTVQG